MLRLTVFLIVLIVLGFHVVMAFPLFLAGVDAEWTAVEISRLHIELGLDELGIARVSSMSVLHVLQVLVFGEEFFARKALACEGNMTGDHMAIEEISLLIA